MYLNLAILRNLFLVNLISSLHMLSFFTGNCHFWDSTTNFQQQNIQQNLQPANAHSIKHLTYSNENAMRKHTNILYIADKNTQKPHITHSSQNKISHMFAFCYILSCLKRRIILHSHPHHESQQAPQRTPLVRRSVKRFTNISAAKAKFSAGCAKTIIKFYHSYRAWHTEHIHFHILHLHLILPSRTISFCGRNPPQHHLTRFGLHCYCCCHHGVLQPLEQRFPGICVSGFIVQGWRCFVTTVWA